MQRPGMRPIQRLGMRPVQSSSLRPQRPGIPPRMMRPGGVRPMMIRGRPMRRQGGVRPVGLTPQIKAPDIVIPTLTPGNDGSTPDDDLVDDPAEIPNIDGQDDRIYEGSP